MRLWPPVLAVREFQEQLSRLVVPFLAKTVLGAGRGRVVFRNVARVRNSVWRTSLENP